jgi:hypothetical protein
MSTLKVLGETFVPIDLNALNKLLNGEKWH